jgi:hypothetical protein
MFNAPYYCPIFAKKREVMACAPRVRTKTLEIVASMARLSYQWLKALTKS